MAEGSLRDAESLFDQVICYTEAPINASKVLASLGILPAAVFFALDQAFDLQNLSFAFELADQIFSSGKDLAHFVDNLTDHYRCLLKLKLNAPVIFLNDSIKEQYTSSAALYTQEQCLYILDFLMHWQQQIHKNPFKRVSLEMILLHIIRSKYRLALPSLVKRLCELEQHSSAPHAEQAKAETAANPPAMGSCVEEVLIKKIQDKIESLPQNAPSTTVQESFAERKTKCPSKHLFLTFA